jgi:reductive dehalogenase
MNQIILLIFDIGLIGLAMLFTYESVREQEPRAPKVGVGVIVIHLLLLWAILAFPAAHLFISAYFGLAVLFGLIVLIPTGASAKALLGTEGIRIGKVNRFDERDQVFARNEPLQPDRKEYDIYYQKHPEKKERDDQRRAKGGDLGDFGSIDDGHPANVSMLLGAFEESMIHVPHAVSEPEEGHEPTVLDPARATKIVKGFAQHIGADLVGVCKVNEDWIYSHRGEIRLDNWEDWGTEIKADLPYAIVIATEMNHELISAAPHTPVVVESARNYAKGAHLSNMIARWLTNMGYRASAQHEAHYDGLMVPMAVDAGLGQLGRQGYLIADQFGCGVRLFAVLTDMPLVPDKPIDLGVEEFCAACLKCAEACPSRSLSLEGKTVINGTSRWSFDDESCHDYWGRIGTDCCVCMAICPYTRPNRSIHKAAKWVLKQSKLARLILPHLDNVVYGRKWRTRKVADWIDYRN